MKIFNQKIEEWSASYDGPKFHAVLCDPPYDYAFMGKSWDSGADFKRWGEAIFPHLYPGALVLMFGGTRTWHRLAVGMEDAGFEIWDTMMWLHGQGFPKAQDISKLIDKQGKRSDFDVDALAARIKARRIELGLSRSDVDKVAFDGSTKLAFAEGERYKTYPPTPEQWEKLREVLKLADDGVGAKLMDWWAGNEREILGPADEGFQRYVASFGYQGDGSRWNKGVATKTIHSEDWSGHKTTALKPAWEPVLCFKKPLAGTYAEMAMQYGSGALNVDGGRIPVTDADSRDVGRVITRNVRPEDGWGFNADESDQTQVVKANGRYPANLLLDSESAAILDAQTGDLKAGASVSGSEPSSPTDACYGEYTRVPFNGFGDNGGASRFYYCAKASSAERNAGLEGFEARSAQTLNQYVNPSEGRTAPKCGSPKRNHHPTVKPIDICRYLATLLLPPDSVKPRRLLVPLSGSGSEMISAMLAGWDEIVGVEQDTEHGYIAIAEARLDWWKWAKETSRLSDPAAILQRFGLGDEPDESQPSLFGGQPEQLAL